MPALARALLVDTAGSLGEGASVVSSTGSGTFASSLFVRTLTGSVSSVDAATNRSGDALLDEASLQLPRTVNASSIPLVVANATLSDGSAVVQASLIDKAHQLHHPHHQGHLAGAGNILDVSKATMLRAASVGDAAARAANATATNASSGLAAQRAADANNASRLVARGAHGPNGTAIALGAGALNGSASALALESHAAMHAARPVQAGGAFRALLWALVLTHAAICAALVIVWLRRRPQGKEPSQPPRSPRPHHMDEVGSVYDFGDKQERRNRFVTSKVARMMRIVRG